MLELEVAPDACISQTIAPPALPKKIGHHVLLNGNYVEPADRMACTRVEGDALAIWPMIARG